MTMYNLGSTYIGTAGIYCTSPIKKINQKRWAVISYTVEEEEVDCPVQWHNERKVIVGNGYCKEKDLLNAVRIAERKLRSDYCYAKLTINNIEYFVKD